MSQSHILAVLSPAPVSNFPEEAGENCAARIASPCPEIDDAQREIERTWKTACGLHCRSIVSSVLLTFVSIKEW